MFQRAKLLLDAVPEHVMAAAIESELLMGRLGLTDESGAAMRSCSTAADRVVSFLSWVPERPGIATLRADGSPRISGIEAVFEDGELVFGSMPSARKGADLRRDIPNGSPNANAEPTRLLGLGGPEELGPLQGRQHHFRRV